MNRLLITTLALSAVLITGAFAEKEKKGEGDKPKHHPPRMENLLPQPLLEKLNLTAEQRAEYEKLEQQFDAERDKYQAAHKAEMEKLREESKVAKEGNDEAKLKEARQKRAELGKPMMELRKSYVDKFAATLTPEQKATLEESRKNMREKAKERREEREHHEDEKAGKPKAD